MRYFFILFLFFSTKGVNAASSVVKPIRKIVIDAGHGGKDNGCSGSFSKEKDVVLKIAKELGVLIKENIDSVEVVYTRTEDVFVELYKRAEIANQTKADLFICLHANANDNKTVYGTETYVMGLHKTVEGLNVQKRENQAILLETDYESVYKDFDPNSPESHIIFSMYQEQFLTQSIHFATKVEQQFKERAKRKSRGVRQAGFIVLYKTSMPSALIETGFLTNTSEEKFLTSKDGTSIVASAIYRATKEYVKESNKSYQEAIEKQKSLREAEEKERKKYRIQIAVLNQEKKLPNYFSAKNLSTFSVKKKKPLLLLHR